MATALIRGWLAVATVTTGILGCDSTGLTEEFPRTNWSQQRIPSTEQARAFDAATQAVSQWFRVAEADASSGLITTVATESGERGSTGRIRDEVLSYKNQIRRRAAVRVRPSENGVVVECVVVKQRLDTSDHQMMSQNRRFDDVNNQTPIEEDRAVTPAQSAVWTDIGRDRGLERDILRTVRERLEGVSPAAPAG